MGKELFCYPSFDAELFKATDLKIKYELYYMDGTGTRVPIEYNVNGSNISLSKNTNYNKLVDDLYFCVDINIINATNFYGVEGICPDNGQLKFAVEWYSQKNKIRELIPATTIIENDNTQQCFRIEGVFPKATFYNDVCLNVFLFLYKSANNVPENELFLNNFEGASLGDIQQKQILLAGTGSMFPIYTKPVNDERLWILELYYEDPAVDLFMSSINIIFNSNHKDFKYLDIKSDFYCESYVNDIVATAMTILLSKLEEDHQLDNLNDNFGEGSILELIQYYYRTLELQIHDPQKVFESIKKYLSK